MMAEEPINLAERRAIQADDSTLWTPLDAARALVRDLESGEKAPTQLVVHMWTPDPDGGRRHNYVAAGLTYETHLTLLVIAQQRLISEWCR